MDKTSLAFLHRLLDTISPSGYEEEASRVWAREARTFADEVTEDQHGNVVAWVHKGGSPRIMLAGHVDEIGFMITHIQDKGFLDFRPIGGWDAQVPQGQRVWIRTAKGRLAGVIGKKPIHLLKEQERDKVCKLEDLWIDIGASSRKEAEKHVAIGDPAVLAWDPVTLLNGRLASRATDDKAGAFVVLEAARRLAALKPRAEVCAVATVQEEVGLRGSTTIAYALQPKAGIAVDVDFASDYPSMHSKNGRVTMGKGPTIARGPNINPRLFDLLLKTARSKRIPCQVVGAPRGTGTDANTMQLARGGVATALVSIPNRYMHSPCEMIETADLDRAARLIAETVARIGPDLSFLPGSPARGQERSP